MKKRIEALEKELAALKAEYDKTYHPEKGVMVVLLNGAIWNRAEIDNGYLDIYDAIGRSYASWAAAEKARDLMTAHDIILKYVFDHCPDYEPDWSDHEENKFFIYYNHQTQKWDMDSNNWLSKPTPYMPKWVAEKLCDDLNNGRIDLYPFKEE